MSDNLNNQVNHSDNEHTFTTIKAKEVYLKDNYNFFSRKWYFVIFTPIFVFILKIFIRFLYAPIFLGFKVKNKKKLKHLKKTGHIFIANHIHPIDSYLLGSFLFPKKVFFTMLESNLGLPFIGKIMRFSGGVPIPTRRSQLHVFESQMKEMLEKKHFVGIFPEAALKPYYPSIRNFQKGAFRFALNAKVAIIPMVFILKKPTGFYKLYKRKPLIQLHILDKYELNEIGNRRETINYHKERLEAIMGEYFNTHSTYRG